MKIKDVTNKLILKQHLGEGEYDGKKVLASITNASILIDYEKKTYAVPFHDIIKEALDKVIKQTEQSK